MVVGGSVGKIFKPFLPNLLNTFNIIHFKILVAPQCFDRPFCKFG